MAICLHGERRAKLGEKYSQVIFQTMLNHGVIYKDGSSEVFNTRADVISACRIGNETLRKCLETGKQDRLGRCYDYAILE